MFGASFFCTDLVRADLRSGVKLIVSAESPCLKGKSPGFATTVVLLSCNTVIRMSQNENYDISYAFYVNFRTLPLYR